MNAVPRHPDDLNPYLDADISDKRYEEIREHLAICPECRGELAALQSLDRIFRSPELEIEVPAWQWSRIQAGLQAPRPSGSWLDRIGALSQPRKFAWGIAFSLLIFGSVTVSVWQYRRAVAREDLTQVTRYAQTEQVRLRAAGNPFRVAAVSGNPFAEIQNGSGQSKGNPFAIR
jgi:anti-sigma factor RsiW